MKYNLITIIGPTACGKTALATQLAAQTDAEVISGDSRQVYRDMDIGTGKDLEDYIVNGKVIPYHLIDIVDAGKKYNLFEFQNDFHKAYTDIRRRGRLPILCGGSGLYIESVLREYHMQHVPENPELRNRLSGKTLDDLTAILKSYKENLHNTTDIDTPKRAIRAIEIEEYIRNHPAKKLDESHSEKIHSLTIGIDISREKRRENISKRLAERIEGGLIEEVRTLLQKVSPEDLLYYGLEYKYVTLYCTGKISIETMTTELEIAIHQFAKRQMTWFRGMERRGVKIKWLPYEMEDEEKIAKIKALYEEPA
ncbi:MAG: tRNA (adenosine(37)-N6)-dimethylallyltransferase MiaA [Paludibacteraceae bacterium]|jgi:tRNA dimethylallyltransferase|nr:tRNA (adenosine(37)-N6)-dimethylallyltransferase MiaA [Paludibacteraceae bacterium]